MSGTSSNVLASWLPLDAGDEVSISVYPSSNVALASDSTLFTASDPKTIPQVDAGTNAFASVNITDHTVSSTTIGDQAFGEFELPPGTEFRIQATRTDADLEFELRSIVYESEYFTTSNVYEVPNFASSNLVPGLSNVPLSWDPVVPAVSSTVIGAYKEDFTQCNVIATTVSANKFVFSPDIATLDVGDTYVFDQSDPTNAGNQLSFTLDASAGLDPLTESGYHVDMTGADDAEFIASNSFSVTTPTATVLDLVNGVFTAQGTINFADVTTAEPGKYTIYAVYRADVAAGGCFARGINEYVGWNYTGAAIQTISGGPGATGSGQTLVGSASGFYVIVMRKDLSAITWDVWDESGTTIIRNVTGFNDNDSDRALFHNQARATSSYKALGIMGRVLSDAEVEDLAGNLSGGLVPVAYNATASGTPGTDGIVTFVPRDLATVYSYSVENGLGYGTSHAVVPGVTAVAINDALAPTSGLKAFFSKAEIPAGTTSVTFGDGAYGESNLEPGFDYHLFAVPKHPTGILGEPTAHAYTQTPFYDVEGFSNNASTTSTIPLVWTSPSTTTVDGTIVVSAYTSDQGTPAASNIETGLGAASTAVLDGTYETGGGLEYEFGSGSYGEAALSESTTYYLYAVGKSPAGVFSGNMASLTAVTLSPPVDNSFITSFVPFAAPGGTTVAVSSFVDSNWTGIGAVNGTFDYVIQSGWHSGFGTTHWITVNFPSAATYTHLLIYLAPQGLNSAPIRVSMKTGDNTNQPGDATIIQPLILQTADWVSISQPPYPGSFSPLATSLVVNQTADASTFTLFVDIEADAIAQSDYTSPDGLVRIQHLQFYN